MSPIRFTQTAHPMRWLGWACTTTALNAHLERTQYALTEAGVWRKANRFRRRVERRSREVGERFGVPAVFVAEENHA